MLLRDSLLVENLFDMFESEVTYGGHAALQWTSMERSAGLLCLARRVLADNENQC